MNDTVRINFHCHSTCSDGELGPEQLAGRLAKAGVRFAALTDHHTLDGLARFRDACAKEGIGVTPGVEMTALFEQEEIHLLAYGFDPESLELRSALGIASQATSTLPEVASRSLRKFSAQDVFRVVHEAGGKVFWAHPLDPGREIHRVRQMAQSLKSMGLDGLEAVYSPYSEDERRQLLELANATQLLVSGGSDFHGLEIPRLSSLAVDMQRDLWARFRDSLFLTHSRKHPTTVPSDARPRKAPPRLEWSGFFLRILLPTVLAMGLLVLPTFSFVIPAFEDALLARKREAIRELTQSAVSILAEYHTDEKAGRLTRQEAQKAAAARVEFLRYGKEGKDYFWITDLHPRMVMHPYRGDLNGQNVSGFRDPNGNPIFLEFARVVKEKHEGYVEYVWQWKDDPHRLASKQSYVLGFEPWGWVIGTGIYIEDVRAEIAAISARIIRISVILAVAVALLLLFIAQQSLRLERRRHSAEEALRESHEKYRALVEASSEGTMLVVDGRLSYANQTLRSLLDYSEGELPLLEIQDVVLASPELPAISDWLATALEGEVPKKAIETQLRKKNGETVEVLVSLEPLTLAGKAGFIVKVRDLRPHKAMLAALHDHPKILHQLAKGLKIPVLRTTLDRRMRILEANPAAFAVFALRREETGIEPGLDQIFATADAFHTFRGELAERGEALRPDERLRGTLGTGSMTLSAVALGDGDAEQRLCEVVAEPVDLGLTPSLAAQTLAADATLLTEPVARFLRPLPTCQLSVSIEEAAQKMGSAGALLVTDAHGQGVGLLTDLDFRTRVVGRRLSVERKVHEIMTAPLLDIDPQAPLFLASLRLQAGNPQPLVARDASGTILGAIGLADLLALESHPLTSLLQGMHSAQRVDEVLELRAKLPSLVSALVEAGTGPENISGAIAAITDTVTQALIRITIQELGPVPSPFAFFALGSQGRGEQTLASDQDNALVFEPSPEASLESQQAYYLALGERVCGYLARAGYSLCKGGAMASNPRFCVPLARWKETFSGWIHVAEPRDLLEFNIFFDLRTVHGTSGLIEDLRQHVLSELTRTPGFFVHLAQNALYHRSLLGFFGNIVAESEDGSAAKGFSIKDALTPIVSFARLYSLRSGILETNTFERLSRLAKKGMPSPSLAEDMTHAYRSLMALRLRHQGEAVRRGMPMSNQIGIKSLGRMEEVLLKEIFAEVAGLQKRIAADFLGGAWVQSG